MGHEEKGNKAKGNGQSPVQQESREKDAKQRVESEEKTLRTHTRTSVDKGRGRKIRECVWGDGQRHQYNNI